MIISFNKKIQKYLFFWQKYSYFFKLSFFDLNMKLIYDLENYEIGVCYADFDTITLVTQ